MTEAADLLIVDPQSIYRCGLVVCLRSLEEVGSIAEVGSIEDALTHPALPRAGLVILDYELPGTADFIRQVRRTTGARVLACTARADEESLLKVIQAGAVGLMSKQTLTRETLAAGVRATLDGAGVVTPELLGTLLCGISRAARDVLETQGADAAPPDPA